MKAISLECTLNHLEAWSVSVQKGSKKILTRHLRPGHPTTLAEPSGVLLVSACLKYTWLTLKGIFSVRNCCWVATCPATR